MEECEFSNKDLISSTESRCCISIPLWLPEWFGGSHYSGVVNFFYNTMPRLNSDVLNFAAHQLAIALARVQLVHRDKVATELIHYASGSLKEHFEGAIKILRTYGIEAVTIFRYDKNHNCLRLAATTGLKVSKKETAIKYKLDQGLTGKVAKYKKPVIIHNLDDTRLQDIHASAYSEITRRRSKSFLAFPILNKSDRLVGVIRCVNKILQRSKEASFSTMDLQIVSRIAEILCQHMERYSLERTREALLAKIPHDLKAPIAAVRNNAVNIKAHRRKDNFQIDRKLDDIVDDCKIMFLLLNQVHRQDNYTFAKTQLKGEVIVKLIKELRPLARSYHLSSLDYEDSIDLLPYSIYADKAQMQHLFFNLLINAIKYSYRDTDVIVSARKIDRIYAVDIENWGIGIDEDDVDLIFKPEVRTAAAIEIDATGTGWGLAIAQEVAERHGGKIAVTNHRSPTIMTVFLPGELMERAPA